MINLLDNYQSYVNDAGIVDLAVKAGQRDTQNRLSATTDGAMNIASVGSFFGPVGTVAGGVGGAIAGYTNASSVNEKITRQNKSLTRAGRNQTVKAKRDLDKEAAELNKRIRNTALSLSEDRGWSTGDLMSLEECLEKTSLNSQSPKAMAESLWNRALKKLRPHDPFLRIKEIKGNEILTSKQKVTSILHTARLVPDDKHPDTDLFDTIRTAILLEGARVVYNDLRSRDLDKVNPKLAKNAVQMFNAAARAVGGDVPLDDRITYAGNLSLAGYRDISRLYFNVLFKEIPALSQRQLTDLDERLLCEDFARYCRDTLEASDLRPLRLKQIAVQRFWKEGPVWDFPDDPHLARLRARYSGTVKGIKVHPIVGSWYEGFLKDDLRFRKDGTVTKSNILENTSTTFRFKSVNEYQILFRDKGKLIAYTRTFSIKGNKLRESRLKEDGTTEWHTFERQ